MEQHSQSPSDGLENSDKLKINTEIKWMEALLDKIDATLDLPMNAKTDKKSLFMSSFSALWDNYNDMLKTGSPRPRAKFVMLESLKKDLARQYLAMRAKGAVN